MPLWRTPLEQAHRGMHIDTFSYGEEQFHPTVIQSDQDGKIYFVLGMQNSSIARLDGLESVRRLPGRRIVVASKQIASLPETRTESVRRTVRSELTVRRLTAPPHLDRWPDGGRTDAWVSLDSRASATVALMGSTL